MVILVFYFRSYFIVLFQIFSKFGKVTIHGLGSQGSLGSLGSDHRTVMIPALNSSGYPDTIIFSARPSMSSFFNAWTRSGQVFRRRLIPSWIRDICLTFLAWRCCWGWWRDWTQPCRKTSSLCYCRAEPVSGYQDRAEEKGEAEVVLRRVLVFCCDPLGHNI